MRRFASTRTTPSPAPGLGNLLAEQGEPDEAIREFREVVRIVPDDDSGRNQLAVALNNRAWTLATDVDAGKRDPGRAVKLAEEAVKVAPKNADCWNILGVARYRAGDFDGAVAALHKYREHRKGGTEGSNPFFLAMAHWKLGDKEEARRWYDRASQWMAKNDPTRESLRRFRLEAQELLGVRDHRPLRGHTDEVRSVAFFPGGGRALSAGAGSDKTLRLWDLGSGKELHCFKGHDAAATSTAVSPDGRRALSGATDRTMRLWDVEAKKELRRFEHREWVESVAFSPDGRLGPLRFPQHGSPLGPGKWQGVENVRGARRPRAECGVLRRRPLRPVGRS